MHAVYISNEQALAYITSLYLILCGFVRISDELVHGWYGDDICNTRERLQYDDDYPVSAWEQRR